MAANNSVVFWTIVVFAMMFTLLILLDQQLDDLERRVHQLELSQ